MQKGNVNSNKPKRSVVYVIRNGEQNDLLKYSLRSLFLYGENFGNVVIIGEKIPWLSCKSFATVQDKSAEANSLNNVVFACGSSFVTDEFYLMYDNLFLSAPFEFNTSSCTTCSKLNLRDEAQKLKWGNYISKINKYAYSKAMHTSGCIWRHNDHCTDYSFMVHRPLVINKLLFEAMVNDKAVQLTIKRGFPFSYRSVYGNFYKFDPTPVDDVVIAPGKDADFPMPGPWFSFKKAHLNILHKLPKLKQFLESLPPCQIEGIRD